jgi:hypothetical protein
MVKADDIFVARAPLALNANQFFGVDVVAIVWRIVARVAAASDVQDGFCSIVFELAEQHAAALVGIGFFPVLAQGEVSGLGKSQHSRLEVKSQIAEVSSKSPRFRLSNLTTDVRNESLFVPESFAQVFFAGIAQDRHDVRVPIFFHIARYSHTSHDGSSS